MGCGSSNATKVKVVKSLEDRPSSAPTKLELAKRTITSALHRPSSGRKTQSADQKAREKQKQVDATTEDKLRSGSATSERSVDSGIGADGGFKSSVDNSLSVISKQQPAGLKSEILSRAVEKPILDEQKVLESLRSEGLIGPHTNTSKGGLTFEVPLGELKGPTRRPPPRLQKLERNVELNLSKEKIREKLARAEKLRKKREKEKLQRNQEKDAKNLQVKLALLKIEQNKEKELIQQKTKSDALDNVGESREKISDALPPLPSNAITDVVQGNS